MNDDHVYVINSDVTGRKYHGTKLLIAFNIQIQDFFTDFWAPTFRAFQVQRNEN